MSFSLNGGLLAMEEIDNGGENMGDVAAAEVAATVADESAEIQSTNTEIGIEVAKVEDAVQAGEELEALGDLAADSLEKGEGMSEETAEAVSIAVESILNRLGATRGTRTVPVAESFGNASSRRVSTKLVVEGIGDWLKKIWASIKAAAARLWDKIRNFLAGLFNSAKSLSKMLNSLKERADKMPSDYAPKEEKIKHASLAKSIGWEEKANLETFSMMMDASAGLAETAKHVTSHVETINGAAQLLAKSEITEASVKAFVSKKSPAVIAIEKSISDGALRSKMITGFTSSMAKKSDSEKEKDTKTKTTASYGPFPGGSVLTYIVDETPVLGHNSMSITIGFEASKGKAADEVKALTIGEIRGLISNTLKVTNALTDFQATQKNAETISKAQQGLSDTIIREAEKILAKTGSSAETRQGLNELKTSVTDGLRLLNTFANNAPSVLFRACRAGADYASVCLRNLGPKGK